MFYSHYTSSEEFILTYKMENVYILEWEHTPHTLAEHIFFGEKYTCEKSTSFFSRFCYTFWVICKSENSKFLESFSFRWHRLIDEIFLSGENISWVSLVIKSLNMVKYSRRTKKKLARTLTTTATRLKLKSTCFSGLVYNNWLWNTYMKAEDCNTVGAMGFITKM